MKILLVLFGKVKLQSNVEVTAFCEGKDIEMTVKPYIKNGRMMTGLRETAQ